MNAVYLFLWIFFIYSFLGWCLEVCFCTLRTGKFVNRGFLNGPVCPIYGFGVVIVVLCLTPLMESTPLLFLGSVVLTSLLELGVGFALEKLFHQRWWDYSQEPFNLGGYICLRFSLAWGVACLMVMEIIHPSVLWLIRHIPHTLGVLLLACFAAVMTVDLAATVRTIARINRSLGQIDELAGRIKALSNDLGENLADRVLDAVEKGADWKESLADRRDDLMEDLASWKEELAEQRNEYQLDLALRRAQHQEELEQLRKSLSELLDRRSFGQVRLLRAFPQMRSIDHKQALERLRQRLKERQGKKGGSV